MLFKRNFLLSFLIIFNCTALYAGTMGPAPSFEGFSLGVGAGYVNTNSSKWTDVSMVSPFPIVDRVF